MTRRRFVSVFGAFVASLLAGIPSLSGPRVRKDRKPAESIEGQLTRPETRLELCAGPFPFFIPGCIPE